MMKANRITTFGAAVVCAVLLGAPASVSAQHGGMDHGEKAGGHGAKPVNAMCPIGKEPIDPDTKTIEYKGKTIGFCCPGCGDKFMEWDEGKRDEFVVLAVAGKEPGQENDVAAPEPDEATRRGDPYALVTCPVSGEALGGMGDSVVRVYDGREVRFCCEKCVSKFEANSASYFDEIDEKIIADQMPYYPLTTCVVSGEEFGGDMGDSVDIVYNNRLVRFCCKMCKGDFKADPDAHIAKLDKAVADAQRENYPLTTCVVSGEELGSMGDPVEIVVANRLVKFCCKGCLPDFEANPSQYIGALDAAWRAYGKFMPGGHMDAPGEPDDDDHSGHGHH